ncbi:hypothetical protein QVD17_04664 [Tagetes erecta]|uniref:Uncharacterized protein n=1 Tax=Tagetes erecta TaxID=13708 RepID=A0AAD8LI84_TARER|nr:hypothetical protein QVD17_04664 [Tagetes erecta]
MRIYQCFDSVPNRLRRTKIIDRLCHKSSTLVTFTGNSSQHNTFISFQLVTFAVSSLYFHFLFQFLSG